MTSGAPPEHDFSTRPAEQPDPGRPVWAYDRPWPAPGPAPAPPGMSTGAKVAVALAGSLVALVVVGVVAAIALPVFLNERGKAQLEETRIVFPATVAGLDRSSGATAQRVVTAMASPDVPPESIAVYGTPRTGLLILMAQKPTRPLSHEDQMAELDSMQAGFAGTSGAGLRLNEQTEPGSPGGHLMCGAGPQLSVCMATSETSLFALLATDLPTGHGDLAEVTRQARAATVTVSG